MRTIALWLAGILLLWIIGKSNVVSSKASSARASSAVSYEGPAIEVMAGPLLGEYLNNEVAADQRFKGKMLAVTGVVGDIGKDLLDDPYVTLKTSDPIFSVQCFFDKTDEDRLASLRKGEFLTIVGRCAGKMGNVLLKNCTIR